MAVACARAGRPCLVADIDHSNDKELEFWNSFYEVCSGFRYAEIMALSRGLGVSPRTVENWKYRLTFPDRKGMAQQVMDWVKAGKPMTQRRPFPATAGML